MSVPSQSKAVHLVLVSVSLVALIGISLIGLRTWAAASYLNRSITKYSQSAQPDPSDLQRSLRMRPDLTDAWRTYADQLSFDDPNAARTYAEKAIALDPQDWRNWQILGIIDYQRGSIDQSRRDLQSAVHFAHDFQSHFELGNLALLQGDSGSFWKEIKLAMNVAPPSAADYALSAALNASGHNLSQIQMIIPYQRTEVALECIRFFLRTGHVQQAANSWPKISCSTTQRQLCRPVLLSLVNQLMYSIYQHQTKNPEKTRNDAIAIWNQGVKENLLHQSTTKTGQCGDGDFAHEWRGPSFSWAQRPGVNLAIESLPDNHHSAKSVEVFFDGQQPEDQPLFEQFVAVQPQTTYRVTFDSRAVTDESGTPHSGLFLDAHAEPSRSLDSVEGTLKQNWQSNALMIHVPENCWMIALLFSYRRPEGEVRLQIPVQIKHVVMQAVQQ